MAQKKKGRPKGAINKPKPPPPPPPKKIMNPHDLKDAMVKSEMNGNPPEEVHLGRKLHEVVRMDPWFGDDGITQTFHGTTVKLDADASDWSVKIVPKKGDMLDADI